MSDYSKIFIGIPTRGSVRVDVIRQLNALHDILGVNAPVFGVGKMGVVDARNRLRKAFLESKCSTLLMIEDDVLPYESVLRMASRGLSICATPVMVTNPSANVPFFNAYDYREDGWRPVGTFSNTGVKKHDGVGFGCVALARAVVETMPPFWVDQDRWGIPTGTEDLPYCKMARARGIDIFVDWDSRADHLPTVNLRDLQERNAAAFQGLI